jgi:hypothetical protein
MFGLGGVAVGLRVALLLLLRRRRPMLYCRQSSNIGQPSVKAPTSYRAMAAQAAAFDLSSLRKRVRGEGAGRHLAAVEGDPSS